MGAVWKQYLSGNTTRTPKSLASLSVSSTNHRLPNIGGMKRIAGRLSSSKLLVVPNVTRKRGWSCVSGSHRHWCKCPALTLARALSRAETDASTEAILDGIVRMLVRLTTERIVRIWKGLLKTICLFRRLSQPCSLSPNGRIHMVR